MNTTSEKNMDKTASTNCIPGSIIPSWTGRAVTSNDDQKRFQPIPLTDIMAEFHSGEANENRQHSLTPEEPTDPSPSFGPNLDVNFLREMEYLPFQFKPWGSPIKYRTAKRMFNIIYVKSGVFSLLQ